MVTKPINVEAQRIQKILADTHGKYLFKLWRIMLIRDVPPAVVNLKVLSLLSNELFSDILRKPEEEVSK